MTTSTPPAVAGPTAAPAAAPAAAVGLYRVVWRWHFYAGVLVTPFLIVLAVTGALYVFKSDIEEAVRSRLLFVTPNGGPASFKKQVDAAVAAHPGHRAAEVQAFAEANRSTVVTLRPPPKEAAGQDAGERRRGGRETVRVYVDPYTATPLGAVASQDDQLASFFGTVLTIHRNLFVGLTGRVVTELVTGWTIILLGTGLYLWWPRGKTRTAGVWWPRWNAKRYVVLRDLHTVGGMYLLPVAMVMAVTGLFYTRVVGSGVHEAAKWYVGETDPPAAAGEAGPRAKGEKPAEPPALSVDDAVAVVRRAYPDRTVFVTLAADRRGGGDGMPVSAGSDFNNSYGPFVSTQMVLDKKDGTVLSQKHLSDGGFFWHGWTYPLHVGSVMGMTSKVLWFVACLVLAALPVTGLWMWWQRRPAGKSGLPRRPDRRLPLGLCLFVLGLCVVFPVVGASVVLVLLGEGAVRLAGRAWRRTTPAAG